MIQKAARKKQEGLIFQDFVWTHTSHENGNGASVGERGCSGLMEKSAPPSFTMHEKILTRRIEQLMHKPKSLLEEIQYRQCLIKAFSNKCKQITENAVFGGYELDLLEVENCINGEDRAHVDAIGVGPIKQFRRLLSLMLLRDFRTLLVFLRSLLCNNKHVVEGVLVEIDKYIQQRYQKPTQCTLCQLISRVDLSLVLDELLSDDEDWLPFYIKVSQNVSVGPNSKFWRELVNRVISHDLHVNVGNVITKALSSCGFHSDIVKMLLQDKQLQRSSFLCRCNNIDKNRSDFMRPYVRDYEESNQGLEERKSSTITPITHDGFHVINNADPRETGFLRQPGIVSSNKTFPKMTETRSESKTKSSFPSETKESSFLKEIFVTRPKGTHFINRIAGSGIKRERTVSRSCRDTHESRMFEENLLHIGRHRNDEECYEDRGNRTAQLKVKTASQECDQLYLLQRSMQEQNERRPSDNRLCPDKRSALDGSKQQSYESPGQDGAVPKDNHHLDENEIIPTLMRELEKKTETQKKNCWSGNSLNGAACKTDSCENNRLGMACLKECTPDTDKTLRKMTTHKPNKLTETSTSDFLGVPNGSQFDEVSPETIEYKMALLKYGTPEELIEDEGINSSFETNSFNSIDQQTLSSVSTDKKKAEAYKSSMLENEKQSSDISQRMTLLKSAYDDGTDSGIVWCQSQQQCVNDDSSNTDNSGLKLTKDDNHISFSKDSEFQRISGDAANFTPVLESFMDNERHRDDRYIVVFDFLILVIFAISLINYVALYSK